MVLGGIDIRIPTRTPSALLACVRVIRHYWPKACFENAGTGEHYTAYSDIPFDELTELFVYRDEAASAAWDAGSVAVAENSMLHLIHAEDSLTIVVDNPHSLELSRMLASIRSINLPHG